MRFCLTILLALSCSATPPSSTPPSAGTDTLPKGAVLRLGDIHFRSNGTIHSLSFSPDSKTLAVASTPPHRVAIPGVRIPDPAVRLLEIPSGKERRFKKRQPPLSSAIFSPDGKSLAGAYAGLSVWDAVAGTFRYHLKPGSAPNLPPVFSPDGRFLAVLNNGYNTISLHDAVTGRELRQLEGHANRILALAFSPDGKLLASSSEPTSVEDGKKKIVVERGAIRLWDVSSGKSLREILCDGEKSIADLHFSGDGKTLAVWTRDAGVAVFEVATGRQLRTIPGKFTAAAFSADGKRVAAGGPMIQLWDLSTGKQIRSFPGCEEIRLGYKEMRLLTFSPDSKWLAAVVDVDLGGRVLLWDVVRGEEVAPAVGHRGGVRSVSCAADGRTVVSAGTDGTIRVWDYIAGKERRVLADRQGKYRLAAVSPDGQTIAAVDAAGTAAFLSLDGKKRGRFRLSGPEAVFGSWHLPQPWLLAYSADGRIAIAGREVWEASPDKAPRTLRAEKEGGAPLALSPDGALIASIIWPSLSKGDESVSDRFLLRVRRRDSGQEVCRIRRVR